MLENQRAAVPEEQVPEESEPEEREPGAREPGGPAGTPPRGSRLGALAPWLVAACYLAAAVALTGRLWIDPAGRMQAGDRSDVDLFGWFVAYAARSVAHGQLPSLLTTAMGAPRGLSLMWNTSFLLPGVLLTPVTLLAGVQVSLTVALTLGFAGSATALFRVLRRWGASTGAAALGGAVYGFSPALVVSGEGHYHLQFAVLPPLIIDAVARLATGRGHSTRRDRIRTGVWLGLLAAAQIFIGEELLVYTAVACVFLVAALAASRHREVPRRALDALPALAVALAVVLVLDGYALYMQFLGPLAEHSKLTVSLGGNPGWFVTPDDSVLLHTPASLAQVAAIHGGLGSAEYVDYLGWPLLVVLAAAAAVFWRDLRVRTAAVLFVVLELCALGGSRLHLAGHLYWPGLLLPWHWFENIPGLAQVLPWRFSLVADGVAAVTLAFALDRAVAAVARSEGRRGWQGWPRAAFTAVAVLAVLPLVPLPYKAIGVSPVPAGWSAAFTRLRLPADAPVLVLPFPSGAGSAAMRWQADTGQPQAMVGGYFLGPDRTGHAAFFFGANSKETDDVAKYLDTLKRRKPLHGLSDAEVRDVIRSWRAAAIVVVAGAGSPFTRLMTRLYGKPAVHAGKVLAWRLHS